MKDGEVPQHLQRWAGADWLGSRVRGYAIRNGDPWLAWIYLDMLFRSFQDGGDLPADVPHLADLLGFPEEQIARVLDLLKNRFGKVVEEDGRIFNPRVRKDLERVKVLSKTLEEKGREGGLRSAEVRRAKAAARVDEGTVQGGVEGGVQSSGRVPPKKTKGREAKPLPLPLPSSLSSSLSSSSSDVEQEGGESVSGNGNGSHPPSSRRHVTDDDVDTVIDAYRRLMKLNATEHPLTAKTSKVIRTALTAVDVDVAIRAIEGCVASGFHMGREGKGVHNGIDRILKDADSIQTFLRIRSREWKTGEVAAFLARRVQTATSQDAFAEASRQIERPETFRLLDLADPWVPWS